MNAQTFEKEEIIDVIVDFDEENTIYEYNKVNEKIKKLERQKESLKMQITDFSHRANHIYNNDGEEIASWAHTIRQIFDSSRLKMKNYKIYERFLKESDVYSLRVFK